MQPAGRGVPEYIFDGPFSIKLTATDDKPGYVVPEFRVDGDGWRNYYGWPTDANAPFQFSNTGTDIDPLNYGKLDYGRTSSSTGRSTRRATSPRRRSSR